MNISTLTHFTLQQWAFIEPSLPKPANTGRSGANDRQTLEAILWIDHPGVRWQILPKEYDDDSTTNCRLLKWQDWGFPNHLASRLQALDEQGKLHLTQANLDATFAPAKGAGAKVAILVKVKTLKSKLSAEGILFR